MPKSDDSARTSANAVKRLNEAGALLRQANQLLQKIETGWSVPDAPERPPVIQALELVKTQATHAATIAKQLLGTLGSS